MLTRYRQSVSLSLISTDLPLRYVVQTVATLEQKDRENFHLLITEPLRKTPHPPTSPSLLWLEISPYRIIMTRQAENQVCYRHFWERGVYGTSRYWLGNGFFQGSENILQLRNFTRQLTLVSYPLLQRLQVEYELWSQNVQLGRYLLKLEIHQ
ncbi:hypothetical protein [Gloeocapsopsis dulcis]|uniref:Uncharacterized protein n=1 Tax=Gloeocapsopsis dulcis AAB1 = 1H9 TaxID=1433147 RepID=A0A6N8FU31_9CHRO|nr:hypothetical protein [Gloeocapsopsis dulcis]MUL36451.1 hypothetical protein [Gloeocapsopsis dulcis AAB1 = 1H9]WNN87741.1 hypothetical protein P0S91_15615 [Gloeocapsopsis dulcis]